jgi:Flp pilus assembly protein TadD
MQQYIPSIFSVFRCWIGGIVLASAAAPAVARPAADDPARLCLDPMSRLERDYGVEPGLLTAIARVESGRPDAETGVWAPWPWTINAEGQPRYFDSEEAAIAAARDLLLQGVTNLDVGCMQVSLHWHNAEFATLEDIFDPLTNIAYAAQYLVTLHARHGDWVAAAGAYHSADPERRSAYLRKVLGYWARGDLAGAAVVSVDGGDSPPARAAAAVAGGDYAGALRLYDTLLETNPDDRTARQGRAMALDRLGRTEEAVAAWKDLLALAPDHAMAVDRLIGHAHALPPAEALAEAQALWRLSPRQPAILSLLGETHAALGETADALAMHLAAHRLAPARALPVLNLAVTLDHEGRRAEAVRYYARFLDLYRDDPIPLTMPLSAIRDRMTFLRRKAAG